MWRLATSSGTSSSAITVGGRRGRPSSRTSPGAAPRPRASDRLPRRSRSASSPRFTRPRRSSRWNMSALPEVAIRAASAGVTPAATISSSSRTLSPCGNTPTSPPKHIVTPAVERRLERWRASPGSRAGSGLLALLPAGVLRGGVAGGERRAQRHAASRPSASTPRACRRRRARWSPRPPTIARRMPSARAGVGHHRAAAAAAPPRRCGCISSSVKVGRASPLGPSGSRRRP